MRKKKLSKKLSVVRRMPPLYHTMPGEEFDILKSRVVKWLIGRPDVLQYLFDEARKNLIYDQESGTWRGKDV